MDDDPTPTVLPFGFATAVAIKSFTGPQNGAVSDYVIRVVQ